MANKLLIKRSSVADKVPTTTDLALGELGVNTYDGKLYLKRDNGTAAIVEVAVKDSSGNLGIGTAPSARLHLVSTTEQLRAAYDASNYVKLTVGSTGGVTLDAVGSGAAFTFSDNVGVGATPSAWGSGFASLTVGGTKAGAVWTLNSEGNIGLAANAYYDGTNWIYRDNGYAAFVVANATDGSHVWYNAPTGTAGAAASLTQAMVLNGSGYLTVNNLIFTAGTNAGFVTCRRDTGASAWTIYSPNATLAFYDNTFGTRALFDASGNFGIGVTPGAWLNSGNIQLPNESHIGFNGSDGKITANLVNASGGWKYITTGLGSLYQQNLGIHHFWTVPSGSAGATATLALRMVLDNSGSLGIGTSSPSALLHLVSTFEQARIGYDASNYFKTTVGSTGGVTFDAVGSGAQFTFSDAVVCSSTLQATQLRGGYNDTTASANTAAQALGTNTVSRVLISASTTLTTTVPPAGAHASVIIQTSGTVSRTVTFGTGFKSQGTLATGAVADRYWVVNFVSDGTSLYETSRTTTAYA